MQFFVYGSPTERQQPRDPAELGKFMEESSKKGILITGGGLNRRETRILLAEGKVSITDGPFLEGKELIPGFTVIQVATKEKAIEWVTNLRRFYGDGETKLVQIFGPSGT
ncbi:MAG TPA: YciI family protein [Spirochaetia bacterium]|nr:YciI family protein [Spirochaetia bacterium]